MASTANITWNFVPGSLSTLIEYRVSGTETWLVPGSPANPTQLNTYPLVIDENVLYDVRLTTNGIRCASRSTTIQIIRSFDCCPSGYTISEDGTYCYQTNTTAATPPSGSENAAAVFDDEYNPYGTVIFDPGYTTNGTGSFVQIPYTNTFWVNGAGYPNTVGTAVDGVMNRTGIWSNTTFVGQQLGFAVCITVPENGTYYVGISCDDEATIRVDGNLIVDQNRPALGNFFRANGYPLASNDQMGFNFFYIYPIDLTAGEHVIEMVGLNTAGTIFGNACLACEIYDLSPSEIAAAESYGDLGAGLLFSSKDYVGQPIQIGSGGIGYTCPPGYSLVLCDGPAYCTQTLTAEPVPCTTSTTTTTTTTL